MEGWGGEQNMRAQLCLSHRFPSHILHSDSCPLEQMGTSTKFLCQAAYCATLGSSSRLGVMPGCPCSSFLLIFLSTAMPDDLSPNSQGQTYLTFSLLTKEIQLPALWICRPPAAHSHDCIISAQVSMQYVLPTC